MADLQKTGIEAIETFVAEIPACTLEQALAKFQGRRTPKTLAAARRMTTAKKRVKIPRHLLRQLWRITGGWMGLAKESADCGNIRAIDNQKAVKEFLEAWSGNTLKIGDLQVVIGIESGFPGMSLLLYRGTPVAKVSASKGWDYRYIWQDPAAVRVALAGMATK